MATPDRFVTSPEGEWLLECKSGGAHASREWGEGDDDVPPHYLLQCMWQLYVTGLSRCDMAGYIGGELHFKTIHRHDGMIEALVSKCRAFYERHILGDEEPAIDGMESTTNALAAMFPEAREPLREATDDEVSLLNEYLAVNVRLGEVKEEKDRIANAIRASIGDAQGVSSAAVKATWKAPEGGQTAWKKVAEAMKADVKTIAAHTVPYERRLDVRQRKESKKR
jgi:predicted phage-related endonuclease